MPETEELKEKTVAEPEADAVPSDSDLDAAVNLFEASDSPDEIVPTDEPEDEPEAAEEPEVVAEPVVTDSEAGDRSKLGRKVANMERQVTELSTNLTRFLSVQAKAAAPADLAAEVELDMDSPVTLREVREYIEGEARTRAQADQNYLKGYVQSVYQLGQGEEDAAVYDAVIKELDDSSKYPRHTGNAVVDARLNFLAAKSTVLEQRIKAGAKPSNPLKDNGKGKKAAPAQFGGDSVNRDAPAPKQIALDADAQDFLAYTRKSGGPQITDEQLAKMFK